MNSSTPDPALYPTLNALAAFMTDGQWTGLFANRLAKRSAAQMLLKRRHPGQKATEGEINRLTDDIAREMRGFRPIKPRAAGAKLLI